MKTKALIAGLFICIAFMLSSQFVNAQEPKGTFLDESGEAQDSTKMNDILDYDLDYGQEKSNTGLILGVVAVVLIGGGIYFFTKKKK